jgi:hypothetical protein
VQALRRLAEVQVFRHRDEIPDVTQFHGEAFYIRQAISTMGFLQVPSSRIRILIPETYQTTTKDVLDSLLLWHHALPSCCIAPPAISGDRKTWDPQFRK